MASTFINRLLGRSKIAAWRKHWAEVNGQLNAELNQFQEHMNGTAGAVTAAREKYMATRSAEAFRAWTEAVALRDAAGKVQQDHAGFYMEHSALIAARADMKLLMDAIDEAQAEIGRAASAAVEAVATLADSNGVDAAAVRRTIDEGFAARRSALEDALRYARSDKTLSTANSCLERALAG